MNSDDDSDLLSMDTNDSSNTHLNDGSTNQLQQQFRILNEFFTAVMMQMGSYLEYFIILSCIILTLRRRRGKKRNRRCNIHRDRSSVISFIHSWSD